MWPWNTDFEEMVPQPPFHKTIRLYFQGQIRKITRTELSETDVYIFKINELFLCVFIYLVQFFSQILKLVKYLNVQGF